MTERFKWDTIDGDVIFYEEDAVMDYDDVVDLLNEQHETIQRLKDNIDELLSVRIEEDLLKENEQLKSEIEELENENEILKGKLWNCQNVR